MTPEQNQVERAELLAEQYLSQFSFPEGVASGERRTVREAFLAGYNAARYPTDSQGANRAIEALLQGTRITQKRSSNHGDWVEVYFPPYRRDEASQFIDALRALQGGNANG